MSVVTRPVRSHDDDAARWAGAERENRRAARPARRASRPARRARARRGPCRRAAARGRCRTRAGSPRAPRPRPPCGTCETSESETSIETTRARRDEPSRARDAREGCLPRAVVGRGRCSRRARRTSTRGGAPSVRWGRDTHARGGEVVRRHRGRVGPAIHSFKKQAKGRGAPGEARDEDDNVLEHEPPLAATVGGAVALGAVVVAVPRPDSVFGRGGAVTVVVTLRDVTRGESDAPPHARRLVDGRDGRQS